MTVVAPLIQRRRLAVPEVQFVRQLRSAPVIVALPSPYILAWRTWTSERSGHVYATREELMQACIPILRDELRALAAIGVEHVQIDEPWLLMLVDAVERERRGITAIETEVETCLRVVNEVLEGAEGLTT